MKKLALTLLIPVVLCSSCGNDKKDVYLVSTITEHCGGYDTVESFQYDDLNRLIKDKNEIINFDNREVSEISYYYTTYEYFDNNEVKKECDYNLIGEEDVLVQYSEYTLVNNLLSKRENFQKQNAGNLILRNKSEYTYDSLGRLTKETLFNTKDSTPDSEINLFNSWIYEYTYVNNSDLLSNEIVSNYEEDGSLESVNKTTYTYQNNKLVQEDDYYGVDLDHLKYDEKKVYNYSKNNLISVVKYDVEDNVFIKTKQKDYTYDSKNRNTKIVENQYDTDSGEVSYVVTTMFEYNNNDCMTRKSQTDFDVASSTSYSTEDQLYTYIKAK